MADKIRVKLIRSLSGHPPKHRATLKAMGLTKMHREVELTDNAAVRGMINQVSHMVEVLD